jgi:hypothetical protein
MTAKQAAAYSGGGLLLIAWLAYGAGLSVRQPPAPEEPSRPVETTGTASLAADVQAQTARLKSRLAAAPAPQQPTRNPFAFAPRAAAKPSARPVGTSEFGAGLAPVPLPPAEPAIDLVGVAENRESGKIVRTAIISALSGDLFLVKEGELIVGRYRVKTVGADAVELIDLVVGGERRLALRH